MAGEPVAARDGDSVAAALLGLVVGTPVGRDAAAQFLAQFRSQRFAAITVDSTQHTSPMAELKNYGTLVDTMGGEFNAFTSKEYTGYYIRCSGEKRDTALDVLVDMIRHSKFDAEELEREIVADYSPGETFPVVLHDGSRIVLRKLDAAYDPTNRVVAAAQIQERMKAGEYLTGLLFLEPSQNEFHQVNLTPDAPLNSIPYETLSPGSKGLEKALARYR